jgi:hypothetical protein
MPRRNRNSGATPVSRDMLAGQTARLARDLASPLPCAACQARPATEGGHCARCQALIVQFTRRTTPERR